MKQECDIHEPIKPELRQLMVAINRIEVLESALTEALAVLSICEDCADRRAIYELCGDAIKSINQKVMSEG